MPSICKCTFSLAAHLDELQLVRFLAKLSAFLGINNIKSRTWLLRQTVRQHNFECKILMVGKDAASKVMPTMLRLPLCMSISIFRQVQSGKQKSLVKSAICETTAITEINTPPPLSNGTQRCSRMFHDRHHAKLLTSRGFPLLTALLTPRL